MSEPIDLQACIGKTFERDGERRYVGFVHPERVWFKRGEYESDAKVEFEEADKFRLWLAGATEVKDGR